MSDDATAPAPPPTQPTTPAGWYADGTDPRLRYWDGSSWTDQYAGPPAAGPPTEAPVVKNVLGLAAMIVGIAAVVFASIRPITGLGLFLGLVALGLGIPAMLLKNKPRRAAIAGVILGGVAFLVAVVMLATGGARAPTSSAPEPDTSAEETQAPTTEPEPPASNPYDDLYGTFAPSAVTGAGDSVVPLPAGATAAIVTASHDGASNFALVVIDANNQSTGQLLVNTIGAYSGTTAYGFTAFGDPGVNLEISADGNWSITFAPISAAPQIAVPGGGLGDGVFLYDGAAAIWSFTHDGSSNFVVLQHSDSLFANLAINEIGSYSGTVPMDSGPSVILINADGNWTIAE